MQTVVAVAAASFAVGVEIVSAVVAEVSSSVAVAGQQGSFGDAAVDLFDSSFVAVGRLDSSLVAGQLDLPVDAVAFVGQQGSSFSVVEQLGSSFAAAVGQTGSSFAVGVAAQLGSSSAVGVD